MFYNDAESGQKASNDVFEISSHRNHKNWSCFLFLKTF